MRARGRALVTCLLAGALAGCGGSQRPAKVTIAIRAASPFADAPAQVDVKGLEGGAHATLLARWRAADDALWTSSTPLRANADGTVALRGVDGLRFLWGMQPAQRTHGPQGFAPPAVGRSDVVLSVVSHGKTIARTSLSRRVTPAGVKVRHLSVRRDGVRGVLFSPSGGGSGPAVLAFGGSEGGNSMIDVAGLLAAHGYTALSLAYFKEPGLPPRLVRIPLEYFARAARILRRQPGVDPGRLVTMGSSRGGEASLLVASTFPRLVHGAIGLVPNFEVAPSPDRIDPAWTYRGRPLEPARPIPVERIDGPVLTAGAGMDAVWDSSFYVHEVQMRLGGHHFRFPHRALTYPDAGHLIGTAIPYQPWRTDLPDFGGTPRANAAATADLWPNILRYLARL